MRTVFDAAGTVMSGCVIAAVLWAVLAAPGFLSERDSITHAVALNALASR